MSIMRLSTFAYHVSCIMNSAPEEFELHPCNGVAVKVRIEKNTELQPEIWDTVYINGKSAGNRHGGVKEFTAIVNAAKPEIEYS